MGKSKIFMGLAALGVIALAAFGYSFYRLNKDLEETFQEVQQKMEEIDKEQAEQETQESTAPEAPEVDVTPPADVAHIPEDATMTPSGVAIRFIKEGDGENYPMLSDDITIHYTGWTTDGEMFDSSRVRGEPATFPLGRLIQGWQKALPLMSKGSRALIWIPGPLAYDYPGAREGTPKGMLVFDIELIDFGMPEGMER